MKVNELLEVVKRDKTAKLAHVIEAKNYIPVTRKRQIAEEVFNASTTKNGNIIEVDSLAKYLSFTMVMIMEHTNIEFSTDEEGRATFDAIDEYDVLCREGLLNPILETFADDYKASLDVLNMYFKDNVDSVNSSEAILNRMAMDIVSYAETVTNKIIDSIDNIDAVNLMSGISNLFLNTELNKSGDV